MVADRERAVIARLSPRSTVAFRVRARGEAPSEWSNRQTVTLPAELTHPDQVQATALSPTRVRVAWNDRSGGEETFEVEMRGGPGPWQEAATAEANATSAVIADLAPETTYTFRVRARSQTGLSEWSAQAAVTMPADLVRPTQLRATVLSATEVRLEWNDRSDNEDSFEVHLRTGSGPWEEAATVGADEEQVTLSGLTPATRYSFRVRARLGAAVSDWSNRQIVTTPAAN